jgi:hypothetical protein
MEIGYVANTPRSSSKDRNEFDAGYYRELLEKAWREAAFVFRRKR